MNWRAGKRPNRTAGSSGNPTGAADLPAAIARLQDENKALRLELKAREAALLALEAGGLPAGAEPLGEARLVARVFAGREPDELRRLAAALADAGGTVALLGLAGERSHLVFCRSANVPGDMGALIKPALAAATRRWPRVAVRRPVRRRWRRLSARRRQCCG